MSENNKNIEELYLLFQIPQEKIPKYESPEQLARTFKICSILEPSNSFYSNTTATEIKVKS